jgi:hypothetical protein
MAQVINVITAIRSGNKAINRGVKMHSTQLRTMTNRNHRAG